MYTDRDNKLFKKICIPIYRELFKKSVPSGNLTKMMASGETQKEGFFYKYFLPDDKITGIIEKHIKKSTVQLRIKKYEKQKIRTTIMLGCSPTGCKKRWEKTQKKKIK